MKATIKRVQSQHTEERTQNVPLEVERALSLPNRRQEETYLRSERHQKANAEAAKSVAGVGACGEE